MTTITRTISRRVRRLDKARRIHQRNNSSSSIMLEDLADSAGPAPLLARALDRRVVRRRLVGRARVTTSRNRVRRVIPHRRADLQVAHSNRMMEHGTDASAAW